MKKMSIALLPFFFITVFMCFHTGLGMIDDWRLLNNIAIGRFPSFFDYFSYSVEWSQDRYLPLYGTDIFFLAKIFGHSAFIYHAFTAVEFLLALFFIFKTIEVIRPSLDAKFLWILLFTSSLYVASNRLFAMERNIFFLMSLMLYSHFVIKHWIKYVLIISAAISIVLFKESGSIAILSFALFELLFRFKDLNSCEKKFRGLLAGIAVSFIGLYFYLVYGVGKYHGAPYGEFGQSVFKLMLKNIFNYGLTDLLTLLCVPWILYRGFVVLIQKKDKANFSDSLIFATFMHFMLFMKMKIYQEYYLASCYPLIIVAIAINYDEIKKIVCLKLIRPILVIYGIHALITSGYLFSYWHFVPYFYQASTHQLSMELKKNLGIQTLIYLEGSSLKYSEELTHSLRAQLLYLGHSESEFKIVMEENKHEVEGRPHYILHVPMSFRPLYKKEFHEGKKAEGYTLIGEFKSSFAIPQYNLKFLAKKLSELSGGSQDLFENNNLLKAPEFFLYYKS